MLISSLIFGHTTTFATSCVKKQTPSSLIMLIPPWCLVIPHNQCYQWRVETAVFCGCQMLLVRVCVFSLLLAR